MVEGGEGKAVVLAQIARGYYAEENFDAAIDTLKQAVEVSPGNVQAIQVLADILTQQGREAEGIVAPGDADALMDEIGVWACALYPNIGGFGNEGFLAKAATEIVDKERAKETELSDAVAKLRTQSDELAQAVLAHGAVEEDQRALQAQQVLQGVVGR